MINGQRNTPRLWVGNIHWGLETGGYANEHATITDITAITGSLLPMAVITSLTENVTVTIPTPDHASMTDALRVSTARLAIASEQTALAESIKVWMYPLADESVTLHELVTLRIQTPEACGLQDSICAGISLVQDDQAALIDLLSVHLASSPSETATLTDSISTTISIRCFDSIYMHETFFGANSVKDQPTFADCVYLTVQTAQICALAETVYLMVSTPESARLTDHVSVDLQAAINDSTALIDAVTLTISTPENTALTDNITTSLLAVINDAPALIDSLTLAISTPQTATLADNITTSLLAMLNDSPTLTDFLTVVISTPQTTTLADVIALTIHTADITALTDTVIISLDVAPGVDAIGMMDGVVLTSCAFAVSKESTPLADTVTVTGSQLLTGDNTTLADLLTGVLVGSGVFGQSLSGDAFCG